MTTQILNIADNLELALSEGIKYLSEGQVVALPTETVYGLAADIENDDAIEKIYTLKQRSFDKPITIHISSLEWLYKHCEISSPYFKILAEKYLPGPLTIIFRAKHNIQSSFYKNLDVLAIRLPAHDFTRQLIERFGRPLVATSANISGEISGTNIDEIINEFDGKIPLILNDGATQLRQDSTIISIVGDKPEIIRRGSLEIEI